LPRSRAPLRGQQPRGVPGRGSPASAGTGGDGHRLSPGPAAAPAGPRQAGAGAAAWLVPLASAIAAFAVGLYGIGRPSFWRDEAYTLDAASRTPGQILALLRNADAVHGAYYLCMHYVLAVAGRSETAVRLPSVAAMAVAAGFLAATGIRLAASSGIRWPRAAGLLAGLLYAAAPMASRYAQEARSYATVTALAVIASYLLVRAIDERRRRLWVGYAVAIALTGLFNLLALLIIPAHAITIVIAARRPRPRSWAVAVAAALAVLIPLIVLAYRERSVTSWLGRPGSRQIAGLLDSFAGASTLVAVMGALIVIAIAGRAVAARGGGQPGAVEVALPWLTVPPVILLAVSQIHPIYDFRYVLFCVPAVALLAADGLCRLAMFTSRLAVRPGPGPGAAAVSWLPPFLVLVFIAAVSVAPQQAVRQPWSRQDYLRKVAQIVSVYGRPGDAVLYVAPHSRIISQGYPGPFRKLRDVALAQSQVASATLNGTEVTADVLRSRFASVNRVWVISDNGPVLPVPAASDVLDNEKLSLVQAMRLIGRWHTKNDLMLLYARR
jgi:mannosyltransferase